LKVSYEEVQSIIDVYEMMIDGFNACKAGEERDMLSCEAPMCMKGACCCRCRCRCRRARKLDFEKRHLCFKIYKAIAKSHLTTNIA
jgi:hypothetical protein